MAAGDPGLDRLYSIRIDGSRKTLHPADVRGRFVRWRRALWLLLVTNYLLLPVIRLNGKPAVQLDITGRRFYLLGTTFNAQDGWLLVLLVVTAGAAILFTTAWIGRAWCGWACPQTVFLDGVYRRIERLLEGPREVRLRREAGPATANGLLRATAKHGLFLLVSLFLAHVFVGYFVSLEELLPMVIADPRGNLEVFAWVMGIAALLYGNFAWFREQLCLVICPYGRLQSVLLDKDSTVVGYDVKRGEPRAHLRREERAGAAPAAPHGDCVDCGRCVTACPAGVDIRLGQQLECIACAQCIDACDEVMLKLGKPRGLVRYDSLRGLAGEARRVLRPRLVLYGLLLAGATGGLFAALFLRTPFEANLLRVRGTPYVLDGGGVRNQFELHLVNKRPEAATLGILVRPGQPARVTMPLQTVELGSLESYRLPIFVELPRAEFTRPFEIEVEVSDAEVDAHRTTGGRFLGPAPGTGP